MKFKTSARAEHGVLLLDRHRKTHQLASERLHHRIRRPAALLRREHAGALLRYRPARITYEHKPHSAKQQRRRSLATVYRQAVLGRRHVIWITLVRIHARLVWSAE